jgi:hypothetical protein
MGKLTAGQWTEVVIWLVIAVTAYYFTFEFDRNIEFYKFGASGWPRVIIVMIFLGAIGQFVQDLVKAKTNPVYDPGYFSKFSEHGSAFFIRMGLTLALPLVYAALLQGMGYYFLTPFFLAAYLYLTGVRRVKMLILVPLSIYAVITFIFTRILYVGLPIGYWRGFYEFGNWFVILLRG